MTTPKIVGFAGSWSRPSRTRNLVEAALARAAERTGAETRLYDLAELAFSLGTTLSAAEAPADIAVLLNDIVTADALIVGSPVYKGTYTGLFKHLFDLIEPRALKDKPVVLTASGGSERHALVLDHGLRPLFAFFSADIIATGLYATEADFTDYRPSSEALLSRIDRAATELSWRLSVAGRLHAEPAQALAAS
jgi:FMN reductase